MNRPPHVVVLIEASREYGRGLLRGVARYIRKHDPWDIYFQTRGLNDPPPPWLKNWSGDGILARISTREMANAVLATGLPAIDLCSALDGVGLPGMGPQNHIVSKLALEHLLNQGFRHFGFYGMPQRVDRYLDIRCECFTQLVEQAGHECDVFRPRPKGRRAITWEQEQEHITAWLTALPKPVGVMACNDDRGQQMLDACMRAGISVPDEVAVVGVNNDEHLCNLSNPSLTSIDVNSSLIGYEAAALLNRLMAGEPPPQQIAEFPPRGIIARQSTDILNVDDPHVASALRFIRDHACEGISVEQAMRQLPISRSTLERSFKSLLGRTPKAEILRVQLDRARELLVSTDLSILLIAEKSGFGSLSHFSEVFHKRVGLTPSQYRKRPI